MPIKRLRICNDLMFWRFSNLSRDSKGIEEFQNGLVYVSIEPVAALTRLLL